MEKHWVISMPRDEHLDGSQFRSGGWKHDKFMEYAMKNDIYVAGESGYLGANYQAYGKASTSIGAASVDLKRLIDDVKGKGVDEAAFARAMDKSLRERIKKSDYSQLTNLETVKAAKATMSYLYGEEHERDLALIDVCEIIYGKEFTFFEQGPMSAAAKEEFKKEAKKDVSLFLGPKNPPVDDELWPGAKPDEIWGRIMSDYFGDGRYLRISSKKGERPEDVFSLDATYSKDMDANGNKIAYFWKPREACRSEEEYVTAIKEWAIQMLGDPSLSLDDIGVEVD